MQKSIHRVAFPREAGLGKAEASVGCSLSLSLSPSLPVEVSISIYALTLFPHYYVLVITTFNLKVR